MITAARMDLRGSATRWCSGKIQTTGDGLVTFVPVPDPIKARLDAAIAALEKAARRARSAP